MLLAKDIHPCASTLTVNKDLEDNTMAAKISTNNVTPIQAASDATGVDIKSLPVYTTPEPVIIDPVKIILDPATPDKYYLRLDFKAMRAIQKQTGDIVWDGSIFEKGTPDPDKLVVYIWACLLWQHPDLTVEDVESLPGFHMMNMPYLIDRFFANWTAAMPDASTTESSDDTKSIDPNV